MISFDRFIAIFIITDRLIKSIVATVSSVVSDIEEGQIA
jgi:hypothetical protein